MVDAGKVGYTYDIYGWRSAKDRKWELCSHNLLQSMINFLETNVHVMAFDNIHKLHCVCVCLRKSCPFYPIIINVSQLVVQTQTQMRYRLLIND